MSKLPALPFGDSIGKTAQVRFGGLRHHINCTDGEFFDMENLTAENYPVLSVRKKRSIQDIPFSGTVKQIYADNGTILLVDAAGDIYYFDENWNTFGYPVAKTKDPQNVKFVRFGDRVVMMPDKKILNMKYKITGVRHSVKDLPETVPEGTAYAVGAQKPPFEVFVFLDGTWVSNGYFSLSIEARVTIPQVEETETEASGAYITIKSAPENGWMEDGTAIGEMGVNNAIWVPFNAEEAGFKIGDAVTIQGLTKIESNNKTAILRGIAPEIGIGYYLIFSDYCFSLPENETSYTETTAKGEITFSRTMPEMDVIFEHENRLWGAKGKEIFASKLGDPYNWNCFDGLSTDSYYLQTQDKGEITAGISFGYPRFFREDSMTTVYGSMPSAFQTQVTLLPGVKTGENKSLAQVGGMLLWISRDAPILYDGSDIYVQDQVFGNWNISEAISQSDGKRCWMKADLGPHPDADGERLRAIFCYDSNKGVWTKESDPGVKTMTYMEGLIYAISETKVIVIGREGDEAEVASYAEFGDFTDGSPNRKAVSKIQLRLEVGEGAYLAVKIQYDSSGDWLTVKTIAAGKKRSVYLPVLPHRCDHYRLRLEGVGDWTLYSMARELYVGSAMH